MQPNGKLLVCGAGLNSGPIKNSGILRLNENGSLDPSFEPPGIVTNVTIAVRQTDGKVLIVQENGHDPGALIRLNPDGTHDLTNWQTVGTPTWEWKGGVFKETLGANLPQRFYRLVSSP